MTNSAEGNSGRKRMSVLSKILGILVIIGFLMAVVLLVGALNSDTYPGMTAYSSLGIAFVVIPYCLFKLSLDWK